jgi:hypothetical protein
MAIAAKPGSPNVVFSAGLDIYRTDNSGGSWIQLTNWWRAFGDPRYVHADHHEIVFHPTHANELWEVTDGGIFRSTDNGVSWTERNNGFVTFQYYAMGNATLDTALPTAARRTTAPSAIMPVPTTKECTAATAATAWTPTPQVITKTESASFNLLDLIA